MQEVSREAADVLAEILEHEGEPGYWQKRFEGLSHKDDMILRGCFKELKESGLAVAQWAEDYPYVIVVQKDGYLYEQHLQEAKKGERLTMSQFERELNDLLDRAKSIKSPINAASIDTDINAYNRPSEIWVNDVEIFYNKYLKDHPLGSRMKTILFHRNLDAFSQLITCLTSINKDQDFIDRMNGISKTTVPQYQARMLPEYDVFLSHANADKPEIVEDLNSSLKKLGVKIFYDKESLEWGDNWKQRILDGTKKAEFAIIVISENFFGREWTEKELNEFLNRQNRNGQKLILPILHNITSQQLREKYPAVADIQAVESSKHSCDEIALLFAKQLIKRLKAIS